MVPLQGSIRKNHLVQRKYRSGFKIDWSQDPSWYTYLLSIIEMHEKLFPVSGVDDIYDQVVKALNSYFNKTCDTSKERMTFREMRMRSSEPFMDWVLRLETQAKFCDFSNEQRQEEFMQALLRRSIPEIGGKLYELSEMFDKNIEIIVNHGQHLDHIRRESEELKKDNEAPVIHEPHTVYALRYKKEFSERTRNITLTDTSLGVRVNKTTAQGAENNMLQDDAELFALNAIAVKESGITQGVVAFRTILLKDSIEPDIET